eukprot:scaffold952_cov249-Pinguiococcus_pyrenoidosus.AAC.12
MSPRATGNQNRLLLCGTAGERDLRATPSASRPPTSRPRAGSEVISEVDIAARSRMGCENNVLSRGRALAAVVQEVSLFSLRRLDSMLSSPVRSLPSFGG